MTEKLLFVDGIGLDTTDGDLWFKLLPIIYFASAFAYFGIRIIFLWWKGHINKTIN